MKLNKVLFTAILLCAFSYVAIKPLLIPGFFPMHDDTQVVRVFEMAQSLQDGMLPVRWVSDLGYGYGYPIFNFYAPLAYYIGAVPILLGIDALTATKIMFGMGIIFSGVSMYFLAKAIWGRIGGTLSAILYLLAPYHALDIYVRGDAAEFWAYAFIPLVFYGLLQLYKTKEWKYVIIGAIGYAGVILSHNLTALMISPFVFLLVAVLFRISQGERKPNWNLFVIPFVGIVLSSFYWVPTFLEMGYTNVLSQVGGGSHYPDHFACLSQLWDSPWGFGGSAKGCVDGMSFRLGKIHILLSVISAMGGILFYRRKKEHLFVFSLLSGSLLFTIFLTLEQSKFIWDLVSPMAFFQFPWRFLLMATFFSSLLGGGILTILEEIGNESKRFLSYTILFCLCVGCFILYGKLFTTQTIITKTASEYTNQDYIRWEASKISDEYMPKGFVKPKNKEESIRNKLYLGTGEVPQVVAEKTHYQKYILIINYDTKVYFNTAYFPAWKVFIDNKNVSYQKTNYGIEAPITKGKHTLELVYTQTLTEKISNAFSISGVIVLLVGIIKKRESKRV